MTAQTIPYDVLQTAIEALKAQATEGKKKLGKFSVSYEAMPLKEENSMIPTLYNIRLKTEDLSYTFYGVWTSKGQRIEVY